jgi:hypothetical protein
MTADAIYVGAGSDTRMNLSQLARSRFMWKVLSLLCLLEALTAGVWCLFVLNERLHHLHFGTAFLGAQGLAVLGCVVGGYLECQWGCFSRLARIRESRRSYYTAVPEGGDATLLCRVNALRPARPVAALTSRGDMATWRAAVRHELGTLYDSPQVPERDVPKIQLVSEIRLAGEVTRALVTVGAADGTRIPGYLFRPALRDPAPALLVIPGHGRGIVQTAGLIPSYQHGAALALARVGFVTLTLELRGFGHLGEVIGTDHGYVATRALRAGTSYPAVVLSDLRRGLTALMDLPAVDGERVGVTGCSLGGDLSITLAALDERVQAVVAQGLCKWTGPRGQRPTPEEDGSRITRDPCGIVPNETARFHYEDKFLLVAPRPLAVINGRRDVGDIDEEESWLVTLLRDTYQLEGVTDRFRFVLTSGGHEYHLAPAIEFLNHHLKKPGEMRREIAAPTQRESPAIPSRIRIP